MISQSNDRTTTLPKTDEMLAFFERAGVSFVPAGALIPMGLSVKRGPAGTVFVTIFELARKFRFTIDPEGRLERAELFHLEAVTPEETEQFWRDIGRPVGPEPIPIEHITPGGDQDVMAFSDRSILFGAVGLSVVLTALAGIGAWTVWGWVWAWA